MSVGQFQTDLPRHRRPQGHWFLQSRGGDKAHDQGDVQVGIEPPRALDRPFRRRRFAVPRQVERYQPVMFDDARVGHQPMKLPAVGAGGVHAQHVLPGSRRSPCAAAAPLLGRIAVPTSGVRRSPVTSTFLDMEAGRDLLPQRARPPFSLLTLRWREPDSNHRFRLRYSPSGSSEYSAPVEGVCQKATIVNYRESLTLY